MKYAFQQVDVFSKCDYGLIQISCRNDKVYFELPHDTAYRFMGDVELSEMLGVTVKQSHLITTGPRWLTAELAHSSTLFKVKSDLSSLRPFLQVIGAEGVVIYAIHDNKTVHLRALFKWVGSVIRFLRGPRTVVQSQWLRENPHREKLQSWHPGIHARLGSRVPGSPPGQIR